MKCFTSSVLEANIKNLTTYSLNPGVIATDLGRHYDETYFYGASWLFSRFLRFFIKTPEQGAQTTIFCCTNQDLAKNNGLYYEDCAEKIPSENAQNMEDANKLWEVSLKMVGLQDYDAFTLTYHNANED